MHITNIRSIKNRYIDKVRFWYSEQIRNTICIRNPNTAIQQLIRGFDMGIRAILGIFCCVYNYKWSKIMLLFFLYHAHNIWVHLYIVLNHLYIYSENMCLKHLIIKTQPNSTYIV